MIIFELLKKSKWQQKNRLQLLKSQRKRRSR
jgi:hypothetical protein